MSSAISAKLEATYISPLIASEVRLGKDALLSGEHATDLRELLERRGVLVFPQIGFTDQEQVEFTRTLGTFAPEMRGEEIYKVTLDTRANASAEYLKGSLYWHLDGTMNQVPILASLLSAKVLSPTGGDTEFCNTYAAWDMLSEEDKQQIEALRVVHSAWASLFYYDPEPSLAMTKQMMAIGEQDLPRFVAGHDGSAAVKAVGGVVGHRVVAEEHRRAPIPFGGSRQIGNLRRSENALG